MYSILSCRKPTYKWKGQDWILKCIGESRGKTYRTYDSQCVGRILEDFECLFPPPSLLCRGRDLLLLPSEFTEELASPECGCDDEM